jgi:capsular polysaccharide transport system permease protein
MQFLRTAFPAHDKKRALRALVIGVPTVLSILYYSVIAVDHYVAESTVIIKSTAEPEVAGTAALGSLLFGATPVSQEDALQLRTYILSPDMLERLDKDLKLKEAFNKTGWDIFYRLPENPTRERFLRYYQARVIVDFDAQTAGLILHTEAFDAELAQLLNQRILAESEKFINEVSNRIAREQLDFANQEAERNRKRLDAALDNMLDYQNRHGVLDPLTQAEASNRIIQDMEAKQAQLEAELRNLQTYLNSETPQVVGAKNAIKSLQQQIASERAKLASPGSNKLNQLALKYLEIKAAAEFSSDIYKMSLEVLEKTRVEAARKIKSLVVISSPHRPEETEWRTTLLNLATIFFISILLYGLVNLAGAVIEDHRE